MKEEYSAREVDMIVDGIKNHVKSSLDEINNTLARVETQTVKTNGRVNSIESWKDYATGAMAVIIMCLIPLLGWALYQIVNFNDKIDERVRVGIERALANYEIEIR